MNNQKNTKADAVAIKVWTVSWIAYIPHLIASLVLIYFIVKVARWMMLPFEVPNTSLYMLVLLAAQSFVAYRAYYLSRVRFFYDESGVWIYRGVFPWARGVYGMRWRDFEDCLYSTNLFYWLAKGYPISVRPRFSRNPTINVPPIHKGREATELINSIALSYIKKTGEKKPQ